MPLYCRWWPNWCEFGHGMNHRPVFVEYSRPGAYRTIHAWWLCCEAYEGMNNIWWSEFHFSRHHFSIRRAHPQSLRMSNKQSYIRPSHLLETFDFCVTKTGDVNVDGTFHLQGSLVQIDDHIVHLNWIEWRNISGRKSILYTNGKHIIFSLIIWKDFAKKFNQTHMQFRYDVFEWIDQAFINGGTVNLACANVVT